MSAIELSNVSFSFNGPPVLEDVTLRIEAGDFVCIVGPNGGGKTTLLKLLLGLLQPDAGQVRLLGGQPKHSRRRAGYMPQYSLVDLRFPVNVMDVVLMGRVTSARWFGPYGHNSRQAAAAALEAVGMADLRRRPFAELSGGQRQRVMIARALVGEPELLLLDEPTASLDMWGQEAFYDLLDELNRRMTVVVVSHDVGFVSHHVRTIICVQRRVNVHSTVELTHESLRNLYGEEVRLVDHGSDGSPPAGQGGRQ
jgi:zinc transport system ATP-binding protein